jgi:LysR family carnitine catabolism transcriptional activator
MSSDTSWLPVLSQFNLNHLTAFAAVADCLSFRVAAETLHVSQSAVSVQIRELESRLGVFLFHRTTRNVSLTDEGRRLLIAVGRSHAELGQVMMELRGEAALQRGLVKVATLPSLAASFMPRAAREFNRAFSGIHLQLFDVDSARAVAMLQNASVDVAILSMTKSSRGLDFFPLFTDELVAVVLADDPIALGNRPLPLERLKQLQLLLNPPGVNSRVVLDRALDALAIEVTPAQELSSAAAMVALVREGFGVAILPRLSLPNLDMAGCVALSLAPRVARQVGVASATGRSASPAMQCLCDFMKLRAESIAASLPGGENAATPNGASSE